MCCTVHYITEQIY